MKVGAWIGDNSKNLRKFQNFGFCTAKFAGKRVALEELPIDLKDNASKLARFIELFEAFESSESELLTLKGLKLKLSLLVLNFLQEIRIFTFILKWEPLIEALYHEERFWCKKRREIHKRLPYLETNMSIAQKTNSSKNFDPGQTLSLSL